MIVRWIWIGLSVRVDDKCIIYVKCRLWYVCEWSRCGVVSNVYIFVKIKEFNKLLCFCLIFLRFLWF